MHVVYKTKYEVFENQLLSWIVELVRLFNIPPDPMKDLKED